MTSDNLSEICKSNTMVTNRLRTRVHCPMCGDTVHKDSYVERFSEAQWCKGLLMLREQGTKLIVREEF